MIDFLIVYRFALEKKSEETKLWYFGDFLLSVYVSNDFSADCTSLC